jgi:hypothetical protein
LERFYTPQGVKHNVLIRSQDDSAAPVPDLAAWFASYNGRQTGVALDDVAHGQAFDVNVEGAAGQHILGGAVNGRHRNSFNPIISEAIEEVTLLASGANLTKRTVFRLQLRDNGLFHPLGSCESGPYYDTINILLGAITYHLLLCVA